MFFLGLILMLVIPQLAGVAVLRWSVRDESAARGVLALFATMATYFVGSHLFWAAEAARVEAERGEPACGAFGAMVLIVTLAGAIVHVVGSLLALLIWHQIRLRRRQENQATP